MKRDLLYLAFFAGILFFIGQAAAQGQGDLDAACGQATSSSVCDIISQQVQFPGLADCPSGSYRVMRLGWKLQSCSDGIAGACGTQHLSCSLSAACARGNSSQLICTNISSMISSSGQNPTGVAISCVWNNPGAQNPCSEHVVLSVATITDHMVGGVIKSMSFIQNGNTVTQLLSVPTLHPLNVIHATLMLSLSWSLPLSARRQQESCVLGSQSLRCW